MHGPAAGRGSAVLRGQGASASNHLWTPNSTIHQGVNEVDVRGQFCFYVGAGLELQH